MKQKHKRFLTRALALGMTLCLSVQMLPVEALAVESQVAQTDSEIEDLQNKIADLEQQVEDLLGRPLEEVYETSPDSDVDPWDAYETDEVSSVLMSIDDVLAITEEVTEEKTLSEGLADLVTEDYVVDGVKHGTFTVDAETQTLTLYTPDTSIKTAYTLTVPAEIAGVEILRVASGSTTAVFTNNQRVTGVILPKGLTEIGDYAFANASYLTSVEIPTSVETIGKRAFQSCSGLTALSLPTGLATMGDGAFYYCSKLTAIKIPGGVETIGKETFYGCAKLVSVVLPDDLTAIGESAFSGCSVLTEIELPGSVETIGNKAFYNCSVLTDLTLPEDLTAIGESAFYNCKALTAMDIPDSVTEIGQKAFQSCAGLERVTLPEGLTALPNYLFDGCKALPEVGLPANLTDTGNYTFQNCTTLAGIELPAGVTRIGNYAFRNCTVLDLTAELNALTALTTIGNNAFESAGLTATVVLPASVTSLGTYAFYKCKTLTGFDMSRTALTEVPANVCESCTSLTAITLGNTVTAIKGSAFKGCTALTSYAVPASVTNINGSAFSGCTALTEVSIPASVTDIGSYAFYGCSALATIHFADGDRAYLKVGSSAFENGGFTSLTLPDIGSGYLYLASSAFGASSQSNGKLTTVTLGSYDYTHSSSSCDGPFKNQSLTSVTFPSDLTTIPKGLFKASLVVSLDFLKPQLDQLTAIGESAFKNCSRLTAIPDWPTLTEIGKSAFDSCVVLTTVGETPKLTTIGDSAFSNCSKLEATPDLSTVKSIGYQAFYNCDALTELKLYAIHDFVGDSVVSSCGNLQTLTFVEIPTYTEKRTAVDSTFAGNTTIITVNFPEDMTALPMELFSDAEFVKDLTFLPERITEYGPLCFHGCTIESAVIPAHVTSVGVGCFDSCKKLESLTVECPSTAFAAPDTEGGHPHLLMERAGWFEQVPFIGDDDADQKANVSLPADWTEIPDAMFYGSYLTDTDFLRQMPKLTRIGAAAFATNPSVSNKSGNKLTSVCIPGTVTNIGAYAFYNSLRNVPELTLPRSVTTLESYENNGVHYRGNFYTAANWTANQSMLQHVYIYNPNLELFVDEDVTEFYYPHIFYCTGIDDYNNNGYLYLHGPLESTTWELCNTKTRYPEGTVGFEFVELVAAREITVTVKLSDDTDVTGRCVIAWTDAEGNFLGYGSVLTPPEVEQDYTCTVTLDDALLALYQNPAPVTVTSSSETAETVEVTLGEVSKTTFTGTVTDGSGAALAGASVTLTQTVNGLDVVSGPVTSGADGTFTLDAPDAAGSLRVSLDGYITEARAYRVGESKFGAIALKELPATTIPLYVRVQHTDGTSEPLTDTTGLTLAVTDAAGNPVKHTLQDQTLILDTAVSMSQNLTLCVTGVKQNSALVAPTEAWTFALKDGSVTVTLMEQGRFHLQADDAPGTAQYVWVYDSEGRLADAEIMSGGSLISEPLAAGDYTVVAVDSTCPVQNPSTLEMLTTTLGLNAETHFSRTSVTIADGVLSEYRVTVPELTQETLDALFSDMYDSVQLTMNEDEPAVGQNYYVQFRYDLKDVYSTGGTKTFVISLPGGTQFNNISTPYATDTYVPGRKSQDVTTLTVYTTANEGEIHLSLQTLEMDYSAACSVVLSTERGNALPVSMEYQVPGININGIDRVSTVVGRSLSVKAAPNSLVTLFIDGEAFATQKTNQVGRAFFTVDLPLPAYEGRTWELTADATITTANGGTVTLQSRESETVTFVRDPFEPVLKVMSGQMISTYLTYDFNNPGAVTTYMPSVGYNNYILTVKEGCGKYIQDGVVYLRVDSASVGWQARIPLYRVDSETEYGEVIPGDVFQARLSGFSHETIGLEYETTEEYKEWLAEQPVVIDQTSADTHLAEVAQEFAEAEQEAGVTDSLLNPDATSLFDLLDQTALQTVENEYRAVQTMRDNGWRESPAFKALTPERQEELLALEAEAEARRKAAEAELNDLLSDLLGEEVTMDWNSEEAAETMGISTCEATNDDLLMAQLAENFIEIQEGNSTYYYGVWSDGSQTIVDPAAGTRTDFSTGSCADFADRYDTKRVVLSSSRSSDDEEHNFPGSKYPTPEGMPKAEEPGFLETALKEGVNAFNALSTKLDMEQEILEDTIKKYENFKGGVSTMEYLKAVNRLKFLAQFSGYIPKIGKLLNIGNAWKLLGEAYSAYNDWKSASHLLDKIYDHPDEYSTVCYDVVGDLYLARLDYVELLYGQIGSLAAQIAASAVSLVCLIGSGGVSALGILISYLAGLAVDSYLEVEVEVIKAEVRRLEKEKDKYCRKDKDEEDDDDDNDDYPLKTVYDPSGYVYEGVFSNRVEGATVTTYYQDGETAVKWNAEDYSQSNPLKTDEEGYYRWDVPEGNWKVVAEKENYKTVDTTSIYSQQKMREGRNDITADGWHTVLPVQLEVHIPLESTQVPEVTTAVAYGDGIGINFSQYMKEESVTVSVVQGEQTFSGNALRLKWTDSETSDHYYKRSFASELIVSRADGKEWEGAVTITVTGKNYADTGMAAYSSGLLTVLPTPAGIEVYDALYYEKIEEFQVEYGTVDYVVLCVTDRNGKPVEGAQILVGAEDGYASGTVYDLTFNNGMVYLKVNGDFVGWDNLKLSLLGREGETELPVTVYRDETYTTPVEPYVEIDGVRYTGQNNVVTVESGTRVTVSGMPGNFLYYSMGENIEDNCPCTDNQILIEGGGFALEKSGYYKFAAYDEASETYSSRVHITVEVVAADTAATEVESVWADDGVLNVEYILQNHTAQDLTGDLWCAAYDPEGQLMGLSLLVSEILMEAGDTSSSAGSVELSGLWSKGCSVKLLYLDPDTAAPLAETMGYTAE